MPIYVGTAGFSYPEWKGVVYPEKTSSAKMLETYSSMFDMLEINSTFYRPPSPVMFEKYPERTGGNLKIVVKLHGSFTHERNVEKGAEKIFTEAIGPLKESGQFAAYLAQFPQSFHCTRDAIDWIGKLRELFPDEPVVCEFRHESWWKKEILREIKAIGMSVASVDAPALQSLPPRVVAYTNDPAYVRLHGRNAEQWHGHGAHPRYTYYYSREELDEWVAKVKKLHLKSGLVYVVFNNHPFGFAPKNAAEFIALLKEILPNDLPDESLRKSGPGQIELF